MASQILPDHQSAIEEICKGQRLLDYLQQSHRHLPLQATELCGGVHHALTTALSVLKNSMSSIGQKSKYDFNKKRQLTSSSHEDHNQKHQKKRKNENSETIFTLAPHVDGHLWRKYGQKSIHNSIHPRSYYRCTYRSDQGCLATKFVQQEEYDGSSTFRVTYNNQHTCAHAATPQVVFLTPSNTSNFTILESTNLGFNVNTGKHEQTLSFNVNKEEVELPQSSQRNSACSLMDSILSDMNNEKMEDNKINDELLNSAWCQDFYGLELEGYIENFLRSAL